MTDEWEKAELEEEDLYTEKGREKALDDDEIEDWQGAWMQGYDESEE